MITLRGKMRRCLSAEELRGFMDQLRKDGFETPELKNAAEMLKHERGWK